MSAMMNVFVERSNFFISMQRVVNLLSKYKVFIESMTVSQEDDKESIKINFIVNGDGDLLQRSISKIDRLVDVTNIQTKTDKKNDFMKAI